MAMFREWARDKGLKPGETRYVRTTRTGTVDLQFSKSADPAIEKNYRTHYISPALSERKQERMTQKPSSPAQPVVFEILLDSTCSECGVELPGGNFLLMEAGQPLCFPCARLSGRVGRTLAGRNLEESALTAAVAAAVRHQHSEYDAMLAAAMDRLLARQQIAGRVLAILAAWRE